MPNIIKNGISYAGSPAEMVTAWDDEIAPDIPEYSLENLTGSMATIETSPTTHAYSAGDYLVWESRLYKVTASIAIGGTLVVGTNIASTSVGNELSTLNSNKGYVKDINISVAANSTEYVPVSSLFDSDGLYFVSFVDYTGLAINNGPIAIINVFNNKNNIVTLFTARGREYWSGVVTIENVIGTVYEELVIKNSSTIETWSVTKMSLKPLEVR